MAGLCFVSAMLSNTTAIIASRVFCDVLKQRGIIFHEVPGNYGQQLSGWAYGAYEEDSKAFNDGFLHAHAVLLEHERIILWGFQRIGCRFP